MRSPKTGVITAAQSTAIALAKRAGGGKRNGAHRQILTNDQRILAVNLAVIHHISLAALVNLEGGILLISFRIIWIPRRIPTLSRLPIKRYRATFLIDRRGKTTQFVSLHKRAWHAGVSQFCGREKCNDFSIGIELEGDGDTPFTNEQYASLAEVTGVLLKKFPDLQFAGHSDIAPERKTDPGPSFDWARLTKIAKLSEERLPFGSASR
jgi:N-acetyl-anhydromuramoyl-L-alanine amidase